MLKVGIEALGLAVPDLYLELADLAVARNIDPGKYLQGLGTSRMSVPEVTDDTVTLATRAAAEALRMAGSDGSDVGLLAVGTETAVDHSKPVASYVQGLLRLPSTMRVFETKHACYGGTAALQLAADWIRSGSARGKKALIICSDIARYGLRTAGEPTQGAGAVAMLVGAEPRLLELHPGSGVYSADVNDFWRPLYSKDAKVDGHYSVQCYLDALEGAYREYRKLAGASQGERFSDRFAALLYHVPYGKMALKAHRHLRGLDGDAEPDASWESMVQSGLSLPSQIGNVYTASLYLALTSLLATSRADLAGRAIGLFSYGSGSCAEFFSGTVVPGAQERLAALELPARLERRRRLSVAEYEQLMQAREELDLRPVSPPLRPGLQFLGVESDRRTYQREA